MQSEVVAIVVSRKPWSEKLTGDYLDQESLPMIKELIPPPFIAALEAQSLTELGDGMQRLIEGAP